MTTIILTVRAALTLLLADPTTDEVCFHDERYDCDGPDGSECEPFDCWGRDAALRQLVNLDAEDADTCIQY